MPANMLPANPSFPDGSSNQGDKLEERAFAVIREGLDNQWHVFHSFVVPRANAVGAWVYVEGENPLEAEFDFVLAKVGMPIIYFECKMGRSFTVTNCQVLRNGAQDVYRDASSSTSKLRRYLAAKGVDSRVEVIMALGTSDLVVDGDPAVNIAQLKDFSVSKKNIEAVVTAISKSKGDGNSALDLERFSKLESEFHLQLEKRHQLLFRDIVCQSTLNRSNYRRKVAGLLLHQELATTGAASTWINKEKGNFLISGPGGTGKTAIITLWAEALKLREKNKRILFLCYNPILRDRIFEKYGSKLIVHTYDSLFRELSAKNLTSNAAELYRQMQSMNWGEERRNLQKNSLPRALSENIKGDEAVYDAIFVDEGQDLSPNMLILLRMLGDLESGLFVTSADLGQRDPRGKFDGYPRDINELRDLLEVPEENSTQLSRVIRSLDEVATTVRGFRERDPNIIGRMAPCGIETVGDKVGEALRSFAGLTEVSWDDVAIIVGSVSHDQLTKDGREGNRSGVWSGMRISVVSI